MKLSTLLFVGTALTSLVASSASAGGHGHNGNGSSAPMSGSNRSGAHFSGGPRFSSGGGRQISAAGNYRRVGNFNRSGVRGASANRNFVRNGNRNVHWQGNNHGNHTAHWNGNHAGNWNGNHHGNWAHHGNGNGHHHCGNYFVYYGGYPYYYPFYSSYYPYSYYDSYYPYGAYQASYSYDSGNAYDDQPVYQGNNVDESYAPSDNTGNDQGYSTHGSQNNSSVADVQRLLARAGFYKGPVDGAMGSRTFYAIRAYQRSHNLTVDGQIGPQLLSSLGRI